MEKQIRQWIENSLSEPRAEYSNLPACPYARRGLIDGSIYFWPAAPEKTIFENLREMAIAMPGWTHTTACVYWQHTEDQDTLWQGVEQFDLAYPDLLAFVSDPGDWRESIAGAQLAPPPCQIVNIHWREEIENVRPLLWLSGYYANWSSEELSAIEYLTYQKK